jgi:TonB-dependent SusC/RagA subfamily outer membrane receptor
VPVGAKLDVSYIGYKTQQIVVGVPNTYKVILKEDAEMLDEVVVTGYGMSQKRSLMTNSISKLDDKVLQNAAMSNAAQSLQGTVSGLRVTNTSGKPGSSPNIVLRGGASINKNLEGPLVVVDGLVRSMDDINPSDIESIQVLKDAASTAIYGARANNGVILVTTKKGVEGRTQITYKFKGNNSKKEKRFIRRRYNKKKTSLQFFAKRLLNCTPDENRTHIVGTGIRYSIH